MLALVTCTAVGVRAFVSSPAVPATPSTYRSSRLATFTPAAIASTGATSTATTRSSYTTRDVRRPATAVLMSLSSPFENGDYDDEDTARQEAQQLEDMIRGRRGIVLEVVEREWRAEMLKTVEEEGERLCDEAYEGFSTRGRGAIFVSDVLGAGFLRAFRIVLFRRAKCMACVRGSLFVEEVFGSVAEPYVLLFVPWILVCLRRLPAAAQYHTTRTCQAVSSAASGTCNPIVPDIYLLLLQ